MYLIKKTRLYRFEAASTLAVLCFFVFGVASSQVPSTSPPQVQIAGTQQLHLASTVVGREFDLYVNLPRGYDDTTKRYPVIYLLDAQWDFPLVQAVYGQQYYDGFVPSAIIVGITWGGKNPDYDSLRARDLTPTQLGPSPRYGGGPKFLSFIKEELIPSIDAKYRTAKNERTLMGSSFGGLFTLYVLFHETELFNRYVLTSPTLGWDNGVTFTYEKEYAAKNSQLPVRVFMAVGGLESGSVGEFERFVSQMKSGSYAGFQLETRVIDNIGHSGSKAEGYTRGLQSVFAKPTLTLATEVLKRCAGRYRMNPQVTIDFIEDEGRLTLLVPGNMRIPLYASSETIFYAKGMYLIVTFKKNTSGNVNSCEIEQYAGRQSLEKID